MLSDTLDLLGLTGRRVALAAGRGDEFLPRVFDDVGEAERWVAAHLDTHHLWITGNPVRPGVTGRPKAGDVAEVLWMLVDVDPEKTEDDPEGTGKRGRVVAGDVAEAVWSALDERGIWVHSGRGSQVWLRVAGLSDTDRRHLHAWIRETFAAPGAKIDATQDPSRLMRLPGSINHRTDESVLLLDPGNDAPITPELVSEWTRGWEPLAHVQSCSEPADTSEPTALDLSRWLRGDARAVWDEDPDRVVDRSLRDFRLVLALLKRKAPLSTVSRLLFALPYGKAAEDRRGDDYWRATVESAWKRMGEVERRARILDSLPRDAETDPSAAFRPQALEALANLRKDDPAGWVELRCTLKPIARKKGWTLADLEAQIQATGRDVLPVPEIRCVTSGHEAKRTWWVQHMDGSWGVVGQQLATIHLEAAGVPAKAHLSRASLQPWSPVAEPFQPRELSGRRWNVSTAKLRAAPVEGPHPTWGQLYRVVGRGLDDAVLTDAWCQRHGVADGASYLRLWTASMLQHPHSPTAYLYLYSRRQNTGKSLLAEALRTHIISGGSVEGATALKSEGGFNGELAGAVLVYLEEANLGVARQAAHIRMKDWVTNPDLPIHPKGGTPYSVPNTTHWIHTSNNARFCPIFRGDTRITAWEAQPPRPDERMTKPEMLERLGREAAQFTWTLLNLQVPNDSPRLRVPALETDVKRWQADAARSELEVWLEATPHWVSYTDDELYRGFCAVLPDGNTRRWTRQAVLGELPASGQRVRDLCLRLRQLGTWEGTAGEAAERFHIRTPETAGRLLLALSESLAGWVRRVRIGERRGWRVDTHTKR